ncbi:glycosyltransferase family 4 protein [Dyadobacter subterraneus]|uniref:Glycosyltransferase family 4 protein n=1 Tax=Dyadobacter subterraneus TaxID=2773304 RepID=A0ABR9WC44_9BACT|nr:glycosyltransferase family 4 protein [Dyadobacter subterraneus]MBE9463046.1 glycosyltransferase family 4 protein [Dyadobacter subterraneus]
MRVLVIHNQLWAHYKSKLFSEIYQNILATSPESEYLVVHIALYEASRSVMQDDEAIKYDYPYRVLFQTSLDQVNFGDRLKALFKSFDEFKPTVLNVTGWFDYAQVLLMIYARAKGVKIVLSSESSSMDHNRSSLKEKIKSWIVNRADAFFCFGKSSADYLLTLGIKPSQIAVTNAAVIDEDVIKANFDQARNQNFEINSSKRSRNFVYVGRLAEEKNLDLLIRAFIAAIENNKNSSDWKLLFVGDGPSKEKLKEISGAYADIGTIEFAGGHPWYKVPAWLAKSDVLILPSKSEPWGLVVNEAMVCGMPVIVSEKCGCAEDLVSNGINGFLFNPESQSELETALKFFLDHPDKIDFMGKESLKIIQPFSSKTVAKEMVNCYRNLR